MKGTRTYFLPLIVALAAMIGCDSNPPATADTPAQPAAEPAKEKVRLTIYVGRSEQLVAPVLAAFTKETGIEVTPRYGETQQLATQLLKEAERSPADVLWAQDASTLGFLDGKGVFAPVAADTLAKVGADNHASSGNWVGVSGRARVLVYNTAKVQIDELPADVDALTDPKWKGRVGWAPENASFKSFVAAMIQQRGAEATQEWLEKMLANEPRAYPKNTPAVRATATGEVDVALVNHYYLFRVKDELGADTPIANHYFRNKKAEAMVNLTGAAAIKTGKNQAEAQQFLAFLEGATAQGHFASEVHEFPVVAGTKADGLPALAELDAPALDVAKLDDLEQTERILRAAKVLP